MRKAAEIESAFSPRSILDGKRSFFLVGIGGAGMSALARMLVHRGYEVRGTDSTKSPETDRLDAEGIAVRIGHSGESLREGDVLVVTDAIDLDASPEVARAKELALPMVRRSQALGWLLQGKKVIAVTGTHGKTTTTGMIGAGLRAAGLDPLIVVGASVPEFGGPVVEGKGDWAVVEACEAYDSFHDLDPQIVVLTNLELDHVDFHGSYQGLRDSVLRFVAKVPDDGLLVYCEEDAGAREVAELSEGRSMGYGSRNGASPSGLPGGHNQLNASAGLAVAKAIGVDEGQAAKGVHDFVGAERRLQVLHEGAVTVIDDYAHHPTEIEASLGALRERYLAPPDPQPARRLIVVYQPHLYSRTEPLIPEFARALSEADLVVLTDIYPAREAPIPGVSSARIAELVTKPCVYVPSRHLLPRKVARLVREGDVVVGMGAGTIADFAPAFLDELKRAARGETRVLVAYGGDSAEREVSLHSGRAVHEALLRKGYVSELVDLTDLLLANAQTAIVGPERPDIVFLAVHGTHAEDGAIQGLLEMLHLPYTGSGLLASALAMDKQAAKKVLARAGLKVPFGTLLDKQSAAVTVAVPAVVKPNAQGSTVGLSFVERKEDLERAIAKAFAYDEAVLVEEWVRGMEISVPVLGDRPLPPVEIAPASGRYDFASKYIPGATEEIVPARLPESVLKRAQEIALAAHRALGCEGATRTDMIVPEPYEGAEPVVLEVNTLPGLTDTSLLPNSAKAAGIEFDDLVDWIVKDAMRRHGAKA